MIVSLEYIGEKLWIPYPEHLSPPQLQAAQRLANQAKVAWPEYRAQRAGEPVFVAMFITGVIGVMVSVFYTVMTNNGWNLFWLLGVAVFLAAFRVSMIEIPVRVSKTRNAKAADQLRALGHGYHFEGSGHETLLDMFLRANDKGRNWLANLDPLSYGYLVEFLKDPAINQVYDALQADNAAKMSRLPKETRRKLIEAINSKAQEAFALVDAPRAELSELEQAVLEDQAKRALEQLSPTIE